MFCSSLLPLLALHNASALPFEDSLADEGRLLKETKQKRKFCNTSLAGSLKGDYAYEACVSDLRRSLALNLK